MMKIITINLPEKFLSAIQVLEDLGVVPSRSEAIRIALHQFLAPELKFNLDLVYETFKMLARSGLKR